MPCRANRCHRAASSLLQSPTSQAQYIWVNDDLLAQASTRFSNAAAPAGRRHGSNVPGPLEARKRLARRRMVGLAHHAASPMPDFGSLFGTGPIDVGSMWKPPTAEPANALSPPFPITASPVTEVSWDRRVPPATVSYSRQAKRSQRPLPKKPKDYMRALRRCTSFDSVLQLHTQLYPAGDVPLSFSRAAFQQLLANAATPWEQTGTLHPQHLRDIARFLEHGLDHYLSGNLEAYCAWFGEKPLPQHAFDHLVRLLSDKIALATIPPTELHTVLRSLSLARLSSISPTLRDTLLADAYSTMSTALLTRLPSYTKPGQRYQDCVALLEGLGNLPPSCCVVRLALDAYSPLSAEQQGTLVPVVAQCLNQWLHCLIVRGDLVAEPVEGESPLLHMLNLLDPRQAESILVNATARFMTDDAVGIERRKTGIPYWLYLLRHCDHTRHLAWHSSFWSNIYPCLLDAFPPRELDAHFAAIGAVDTARVILRHWIRPRILDGIEPPRLKAMVVPTGRFDDSVASYTVSHSPKSHASVTELEPVLPSTAAKIPAHELMNSIEAELDSRISSYAQDCSPEIRPFIDLVDILHRKGLNHEHILDETFKLLPRYQSITRIFTLAMKLRRESVPIPPAIAVPLISLLIDTGNPGYALRIYQACDNVWPSLCPELVFALIENAKVHTQDLFDILNRPEFANSLPMPLRSEASNTLSEQRVQLIHHVAYALAASPHLTSREAFRRVCDCLDYLVDRKAPLSSLISRALVTAGVIRDLQDGHWVSTVKFQWIIGFVRKYEGDHVAAQLDKIAFRWRSDNVDKYGLKERMTHLYKQKEVAAVQYRQALRHGSHRWKRRTAQWKPWLADNAKSKSAKGEDDSVVKREAPQSRPEQQVLASYSPIVAAAAACD